MKVGSEMWMAISHLHKDCCVFASIDDMAAIGTTTQSFLKTKRGCSPNQI